MGLNECYTKEVKKTTSLVIRTALLLICNVRMTTHLPGANRSPAVCILLVKDQAVYINCRRSTNVCSILDQRSRRRIDIETTLDQHHGPNHVGGIQNGNYLCSNPFFSECSNTHILAHQHGYSITGFYHLHLWFNDFKIHENKDVAVSFLWRAGALG